jgi:hypothetical protein
MHLTSVRPQASCKLHRGRWMLAAALPQRRTIYDTRQDIREEIFFDA